MTKNTNTALVPQPASPVDDRLQRLLEITINGLDSPHTRRAYKRDIEDFLEWWQEAAGGEPLNKATLDRYRAFQHKHGRSESAINRNLSAVRRFIDDAAENNLIDAREAESAKRVKNFKLRGQRQGQWLNLEQLAQLIGAPSAHTLRGHRDCMVLALLGGAGLRRNEMSVITCEHIQQREGRWVIIDLKGKGKKKRTIPIAGWVHALVTTWQHASGLSKGRLFRRVGCPSKRGRHHQSRGQALQARLGRCAEDEELVLGPYPTDNAAEQEIYRIVKRYADQIQVELAPHDLRRTYAKLSRAAGAQLEQIQLTLGHESLSTTERYLGSELDFKQSPSDLIDIVPFTHQVGPA